MRATREKSSVFATGPFPASPAAAEPPQSARFNFIGWIPPLGPWPCRGTDEALHAHVRPILLEELSESWAQRSPYQAPAHRHKASVLIKVNAAPRNLILQPNLRRTLGTSAAAFQLVKSKF